MNETAVRHEAEKILAELPARISDVITPFARQIPDHPALVQNDVTWTYAQLAAVVAETTVILQLYDIRPGDRVMIVSENGLALAALILACSEIDVWSVLVSTAVPGEVDLIREHSGARRAVRSHGACGAAIGALQVPGQDHSAGCAAGRLDRKDPQAPMADAARDRAIERV
jgi:acyl-CoA synthetase (AMP-forming)/AMP-acid ligase II